MQFLLFYLLLYGSALGLFIFSPFTLCIFNKAKKKTWFRAFRHLIAVSSMILKTKRVAGSLYFGSLTNGFREITHVHNCSIFTINNFSLVLNR